MTTRPAARSQTAGPARRWRLMVPKGPGRREKETRRCREEALGGDPAMSAIVRSIGLTLDCEASAAEGADEGATEAEGDDSSTVASGSEGVGSSATDGVDSGCLAAGEAASVVPVED